MKTVAVIGLGRFGRRLALSLMEAGLEVIAIDREREEVDAVADRTTQALALDATDEAVLRDRAIHKADAAVIAIGEDFEASVLATITLKQLGTARIIARAQSERAAEVLRRVGADDVVMPEREAADRWAARLIGPRVLNQIEFHEGYSIVEVATPAQWRGRSLSELGVRANLNLHVVAVKRAAGPLGSQPAGVRIDVPSPTEPLRETDILILMGRDEDLARLPQGP